MHGRSVWDFFLLVVCCSKLNVLFIFTIKWLIKTRAKKNGMQETLLTKRQSFILSIHSPHIVLITIMIEWRKSEKFQRGISPSGNLVMFSKNIEIHEQRLENQT